jgi:glycosyltransferase involved in cell wall biosynthesis
MRVGFAFGSLHGAGAELVGRRWVEGLSDAGHDVFTYLCYRGAERTADLVQTPVRVFSHHGKIARLRGLAPWLRECVVADRVEILVSMLTFQNLVALAGLGPGRTRPARLVIVEHNVPSVYLPLGGVSPRVQRVLARRVYRYADAAVGVSHAVAADLIGGYGCRADRTFVLPNPVLASAAGLAERRRADTDRDGPDDALVLAFAGRLVEQKRPDRFLDVIVELNRRGGRTRGIMIGDGPLRAGLEQRCRSQAIPCEFAGWREPWHEAARAADVVVLPSAVEGFGNVLVEAASVGLPSVACSPALGVADAIVPGVTGCLAVSGSVPDLADAAVEAARLGPLTAPTAWLARFSREASTPQLERVLELVAEQRPAVNSRRPAALWRS